MKRAIIISLLWLPFFGCNDDPPTAHQALTIAGETCADCHQGAYDKARFDHASVGFDTTCATCHTETNWEPTQVPEHREFVLENAHQKANCAACHSSDRADPQPLDCVGCHAADRDQAKLDHTDFPAECTNCHTTVAWRPATLDDHDQFYPIVGAHTEVECSACHVNDQYKDTPRTCVGCHNNDSQTAEPTHETLSTECTNCHTQVTWKPSTFDHEEAFPITGAHTLIDCQNCHTNGYEDTPRTCVGCHAEDRDQAEPDHSELPNECLTCHTDLAWKPAAGFDHDEVFRLRGAHQQVECAECHVNNVFAGTPRTCVGCHAEDRDQAMPNHAGFRNNCLNCHTNQTWQPSTFAHDDVFRLDGSHQRLECESCHANNRYAGTPTECVGCHAGDRDRANPSHANFPNECTNCHGTVMWRPASFDHDTTFPLRGAHQQVDCANCHVNNVFAGTPRDCVGCHADDRDRANPSHANFPNQCSGCHTTARWRPANFEHDDVFRLRGAHRQVDCANCHINNVFAGTPRDCVGCHADDRNRANPDHSGFNNQCNTCHTNQAWRPSTFDHDDVFRLDGSHQQVDCASCHVNNVFAGTPRDCVGCHADDRNRANPSHANFPNECTNCHGTVMWRPANFDHNQTFPLRGAHQRVDCAECHVNNVFAGTPRNCVGCHAADRNRANPSHANFPDDCTSCHGNAAWQPADFNHDGFFRLEGAHQQVACASCHVNDVFAGTPRNCVGCHNDDRDRANPNHGVFDNTCTDCHSQNRWAPSTYRHRIRLPHRGVAECAECHRNPNNYPDFSCTHCHEHTQARMDRKHRGYRDYRWVSSSCIRCHPQGRE